MRRTIAAVLRSYFEFIKEHPFVSLVLSLTMAAACAVGLYLIIKQLPTLMQLPCFSGGCPN